MRLLFLFYDRLINEGSRKIGQVWKLEFNLIRGRIVNTGGCSSLNNDLFCLKVQTNC